MNNVLEDDHKIVYDDGAIDRLIDRSQQGIEEKEDMMTDYLSSFKVAHYSKREVSVADEEDDEDEEETRGEIIKQDLDPADPTYWEKLLRHHYEQDQEDLSKSLGKGKRIRKQVNYSATQQEDDNWNDAVGDSDHESGSINKVGSCWVLQCNDLSLCVWLLQEEDDEEYDESRGDVIGTRRSKRERDGTKMPPLLVKVNGQLEVLGFNVRQRKAFINAVMRYRIFAFVVMCETFDRYRTGYNM